MDPMRKKFFLKICIATGAGLVFSLLLLIHFRSEPVAVVKTCISAECEAAAVNLQQSMNLEVRPCDDFYQYACGHWAKNHRSSQSENTVQLRVNKNLEEIAEFLRKTNTKDEPEAVHKARKVFSLCTRKDTCQGNKHIDDIFSKIGISVWAMKTNESSDFDYVTAMAKLTRLAGIKMFFDISVQPNPYNKSVNSIWLSKPSLGHDKNKMNEGHLTDLMAEIKWKICNGFLSSGCSNWSDELANVTVQKYVERLKIMDKLYGKSNPTKSLETYTLLELQKKTDNITQGANTQIPKFNWTAYIEEMFKEVENISVDLSNNSNIEIITSEIDYTLEMLRFIFQNDKKNIELAFWWEVIYTLLPYTDSNIFEKENSSESLSKKKKCASIVASYFGPAIGYLYVEKDTHDQLKKEVLEMFENVKNSFEKIQKDVPWLDEKVKQKVFEKLATMKLHVIHPQVIESSNELDEIFKNVNITDDFLEIIIKQIQDQIKNNLKKLNRLNDINDTDWILPSDMGNAFYAPNFNAMFLSIGILGESVYSRSLKALDYGSVGQILGHELTHGLYNLGRNYNEEENLGNSSNENVSQIFNEKTRRCFVKAYSKYLNFGGISLDSHPSYGMIIEDIFDNYSGFKEALLAYRKFASENGAEFLLTRFENFSYEQLFTLGYANFWCERPRQASLTHMQSFIRVNEVLKNSKEFSEIWNCPVGSNMNPVDKCFLW